MHNGTLLAALDLGSNSFRLEIGRYLDGHIERMEYFKETVRLGSGLDEEGILSVEAMQRGWSCLARFAESIHSIHPQQIRAVATQTLREAKNREFFLSKAKEILGFPVNIISGREEARLIYQGVAHMLPQSNERRLVVDIGGRSTECILGMGYQSSTLDSYRLGSVSWSQRFFPQGRLTAQAFKEAQVAAQALLEQGQQLFAPQQWDTAYGSSGSIGALAEILDAQFQSHNQITIGRLEWVQDCLLKSREIDKINLQGLKADRRAVIAGGLCVLMAVMRTFGIDTLYAVQGALRHGVLFDMVSRETWATDTRAFSIERLAKRFGVDKEQAERVRTAAQHFFQNLLESHLGKWLQKRHPEADVHTLNERVSRKLDWVAQVHEIGTIVSRHNYHKHGAYILQNADVPGFSFPELTRLGQLVLGQRGKLRKLDPSLLEEPVFQAQLLSLRISVILCHARNVTLHTPLHIEATKSGYTLKVPKSWAEKLPQSMHLLEQEVLAWAKVAITLKIKLV